MYITTLLSRACILQAGLTLGLALPSEPSHNESNPNSILPRENPEIRIDFMLSGEQVEITRSGAKPEDIIWNIWNRRGERFVDETPVHVGGPCYITFDGKGADSWGALNGLGKVLDSLARHSPMKEKMVTTWTSEERTCTQWCGPVSHCCQYKTETVRRTKIPRKVELLAINEYPNEGGNSWRGEMQYEIDCGAAAMSSGCSAMRALELVLDGLALVPIIGDLFGAANVVRKAHASLSGC